MVESSIKIPSENIFVSKQVQACFDRLHYVHSMYHDKSIVKQAQLITADSGTGKTYILNCYKEMFAPVKSIEKTTIPVFYYAFRHPKRSVDEMVKLLIDGLGGPIPTGRLNSAELEHQLVTLLNELEVELVFLDEVQNLVSSYDGVEFQNFIKYLCWLIDSEQIRCSFVFVGTKQAKRLMTFGETQQKFNDNEQMSRRMLRPIELWQIKPRTHEWVECCNWFVNKIGLPPLTVENNKNLLDRLYIVYKERNMSSLRDVFLQPNCEQSLSIKSLIKCLKANYNKFCKGELNPFDEEQLSDAQINDYIINIKSVKKQEEITRKTKAEAAFGL